MTAFIVWDEENKQTISVNAKLKDEATHEILKGKFCIRLQKLGVANKYGMWTKYSKEDKSCHDWINIEWEKFPKEFKTALLLQGIDHESL